MRRLARGGGGRTVIQSPRDALRAAWGPTLCAACAELRRAACVRFGAQVARAARGRGGVNTHRNISHLLSAS